MVDHETELSSSSNMFSVAKPIMTHVCAWLEWVQIGSHMFVNLMNRCLHCVDSGFIYILLRIRFVCTTTEYKDKTVLLHPESDGLEQHRHFVRLPYCLSVGEVIHGNRHIKSGDGDGDIKIEQNSRR